MSSIHDHLHPGFVGERPEEWDDGSKQDFALHVLTAYARNNHLNIPADRVHSGTWY